MKKIFIGIDFSKETFDVSVIDRNTQEKDEVSHRSFTNSKEGFEMMLKWVGTLTKERRSEWLFCGEHTGLYSVAMSEFMTRKKLFLWLESPLRMKKSSGFKREKNDRIDSQDAAWYARRYEDRAKAYVIADKDIQGLSLLLSHRDRLVDCKCALQVSSSEMRRVYQRDSTARFIFEQSAKEIERLEKEIKDVEAKMLEIIQANDELNDTYEIVSSIKGVALIVTTSVIVATMNFTRFETSRQFACHCGSAPFGKSSGTTLNVKPHVSHTANKKLKVLLTASARCAVVHDPNIRAYFRRKKAEGKDDWLVINNVRSKLIHRMFALVRKGELYQIEPINIQKQSVA